MEHSPRRLRRLTSIILFASAVFMQGCSPKPVEKERYEIKGKVVSVDRARGEVSLDHEPVKGYMAAMTMDFPVRDAEALKVMEAGDQVQAFLVVADDSSYWLESPVITKGLSAGPVTPPAGSNEPRPGSEVPDVKLVNHDGHPLSPKQFKGRALVVNFIYTRCPLPDQCPLLSANFARLNSAILADEGLRKRAHLLSVTLDPEYDRPEVLKAYGRTYAGGEFDNWDFATGEPAEVRRLAESFGLIYKAEGDQVIHSLRTAVITPEGKLFKVYRGNEWKPDEVLSDLKNLPVS
ncbi:MAG TPA: SCO family protein [Pyrinomonadaceae bacterium]|nr:SCO family protein [Pyrinomonadaceae bacterium]